MILKNLLILLIFLVLHSSESNARMGKVFFENGRWIKGDIQIQEDENKKEIVVVALKSGSVTFQKSEVKNIVYTSNHSLSDTVFHKALQNTKTNKTYTKFSLPYELYIRMASAKHQLDPDLIKAVIKQESDFDSKNVSQKGAQGLMQLMPDTARKLGVQDAFDPWENIHGGTRYLRMMLEDFNWDLKKALAAYNAGPGVVRKYGTIPPYQETHGYVKNVLKYYQIYHGSRLYAFEDKNGRLVITDLPYSP